MPVQYEPFSAEWRDDPFPKYRELRNQAPVYYAPRPYAKMNFRYGGGYRHHHRGNPHGR